MRVKPTTSTTARGAVKHPQKRLATSRERRSKDRETAPAGETAARSAPAGTRVHGAASSQLDKHSFVPLYFQIQERLMELINRGEVAEGDLLGSEDELSRRYGVSRMTARQALRGLKEQGYAFSQKGRGTFVCRPKLEKNILHLQGFTEEMKQRGFRPSSRLLEQTVAPADPELAQRLLVAPRDPVLRLVRLRLADGIPLALETSHLALPRFPGLERFDFGRRSLYGVLRERYGVRVGWADEVLEAVLAGREDAHLLTVPPRSGLLVITRTVVTVEGAPIESVRSLYRGDRYRAVLRVPATSLQ